MIAMYTVKILAIKDVTHDVKYFRLEKPDGYTFVPGQATEVSINKPGWEEEKRPFTFTSLNEDPYIEFTIKRYGDHSGVTNYLHTLNLGDELIIRDVWGAISYSGPGYFIAGGAGITPFIAILRQLHKENRLAGNTLLFSNKTIADIIYREELSAMLGKNFINVITGKADPMVKAEPGAQEYRHGRIGEELLRKEIPDFKKHFYVCGPDPMISDVNALLVKLGADIQNVVFEK